MSKHHSSSSGDNPAVKNTTNQGATAATPEFATELEDAAPAPRMSTEIKIGLGTLGALLLVLVGVLVYRIWQAKGSDGSPALTDSAKALANNDSGTAEMAAASPKPDSETSPTARAMQSATGSEAGDSVRNVDYSNPAAAPTPASAAPTWPAAASSPAAGSSWAEVDIGQTMLPEPPNHPEPENHWSHDENSAKVAPSSELPSSPSRSDAAADLAQQGQGDQKLLDHASAAAPSDIPFGPWSVSRSSSASVDAASSSASAEELPPAESTPATAEDVAPDFFAGGMPITRNGVASPQAGPFAAGAPGADSPDSAPQGASLAPSNRENPTSVDETAVAASPQPFGQGDIPSAPAAFGSAPLSSSESGLAASGLATVEPARPIGSAAWAGSPTPHVPPLSAGNAAGSAAISGKTYTVQEGETLFDIARRQLGKASRWVEIYDLNRGRLGKQMEGFRPGITLILPQAESAASVAPSSVLR
ncbi:MAG: LysM peptidoglycan-binding domain-containing protein [Thermogutta sp.]